MKSILVASFLFLNGSMMHATDRVLAARLVLAPDKTLSVVTAIVSVSSGAIIPASTADVLIVTDPAIAAVLADASQTQPK